MKLKKKSSGVLGNSLLEYGCKWTFVAYHRARVPLGQLYMQSRLPSIPNFPRRQSPIRQDG